MCLATVCVESDGRRQEVMADVAWVHFEDDGLRLVSLLGVRKVLPARVKSIDLVKGLIFLDPTPEPVEILADIPVD